jgi:HAD superfamily hydrolase (TIGR01509 family)
MIDAVVSDLGNVLLFFDNTIFFRRMAASTARTVEEIRRVTEDNTALLARFECGRMSPREFYEYARGLFDARATFEEFFAAYTDVFVPNPPAIEALRRLKPGRRMALLSNTDVRRWTFIKSRFPEILFFDAYALSFEAGVMKPDPAIYRRALAGVGVEPERAVFIDDLAENVEEARRLGMAGIHVTPGTDLAAELAKFGLA